MAAPDESPPVAHDAPAPAPSGWTGGQFSVWRGLLGLAVVRTFLAYPLQLPSVHAPEAFAYAGPLVYVATGVALGLGLLCGAWGRQAPAGLALVWLAARLAVGVVPGMEAAALERHLLLLPALVLVALVAPPRPYLSWDAAGRVDPDGGWRLGAAPRLLAWALLVLLVAAWSAGWIASLRGEALPAGGTWAWNDPVLRAAAAPALAGVALVALLACWSRARPWVWALAAGAAGATWLAGLPSPAEVGPSLLVLALAFEPSWIPPRRRQDVALVFFDGTCGLCHRTVRFALAEEPGGGGLRFAPLRGETFEQQVSAERRAGLPDSIVVRTPDGALLQRGDAVLQIGARLGGLWRALAGLARIVPRPLRDGLYDQMARLRQRLFARPEQACPIVPPRLAGRFLP